MHSNHSRRLFHLLYIFFLIHIKWLNMFVEVLTGCSSVFICILTPLLLGRALFFHLKVTFLPSAGSPAVLFRSPFPPSAFSPSIVTWLALSRFSDLFSRFFFSPLLCLSCLPPSPAESFPRRGRRRRHVATSRNSEKSNNWKKTSRLAGWRCYSNCITINMEGALL